MPTVTRECHTPLQLTVALALLVLIPTPGVAQTTERSLGDAEPTTQNILHPRTFLLTPRSIRPPSDPAPEDASLATIEAGGSVAGQSPVRGIPLTVKPAGRKAPRRQELTSINFGPKFVNVLFGGFEQGGGVGLGIELTTANKIPGIEFRARAMTSIRLYRRFELSAFLPKIGDDKTHAEVWFSYLRRTRDTFFGIGPRSSEGDRTNFDLETRDAEAMLFRDFTPSFQAGVYLGRLSISSYRGQFDDEPAIDVLFSGDPNVQPVTRWVPALKEQLRFFAYGAFFEYDGRNDESGLTRGGYIYGRLASADGLNNNIPTTYGWTEGQLDGRVYVPLGSRKTSFALRAMADLRSPKGGSQVPFYANAFLGGRRFVRGFSNYRFRSHNLLLYSGELRQTVFALKEDRGVDIAFFGDVGKSWGDTRSKTNPAITINDKYGEAPWRAGYGPAIQFRYNKDLAVRIDWGHSPERNAFYFSISRGF